MQSYPVDQLPLPRLLGRGAKLAPELEMYWSGSGIELGFRGNVLQATLSADYLSQPPWVVVTADGEPIARFPLKKGKADYLIFCDNVGAATRDLAILRDTQPIQGDCDQPVKLHALSMEGEPLPPSSRAMTLEFIGDSLTTGEGLRGNVGEMEWLSAWMSCAETYAAWTSRLLNAESRYISQSGWGVYCDHLCDTARALPKLFPYEYALAGERKLADFDTWQPDATVIHLLTNDSNLIRRALERGESGDRERALLTDAALRFIQDVRKAYPNTYILWVYGMCDHLAADVLADIERRCTDTAFSTLLLPHVGEGDVGSRAHPGRAFHEQCGRLIAQVLQTRMKRG